MDHIALAAQVLEKAEAGLRELAAKAASGGDYAGVVQLASWGKIIRDLLEKKLTTRDNAKDASATNGNLTTVVQAKNGPTSHKKQKVDYPRFYRKADELIRVAWSRRARAEYQHKTSETVLKSVTETLSRLGRKGRIFSTDEALPVRDADGLEVPAYQAYVCIALFKVTGLIEQHGRQGYSIASPDDFTESVETIWRKLPAFK